MIALGSDHGGFFLKEHIKQCLTVAGIPFKDYGILEYQSVDYPDISLIACRAVLSGECEKGILFCGTGIGISIAANKIDGIRCALLSDCYSAKMAVEHNNANMIALGGRVLGPDLAYEIVTSYLNATFQGGRHQKRVDKIHHLEFMQSKGE